MDRTLHPCPSCKNVCMVHPKNHCADCYLAAQIVAGIREEDEILELMRRTGQIDRILSISDRIETLRSIQSTN